MNTNLASYIMEWSLMKMITSILFKKMKQTYALDKAEGSHQVGESVRAAYRYEAKTTTHDT